MKKKGIYVGLAAIVLICSSLASWQYLSVTDEDERIEQPIVLPTPDPAFVRIPPPTMLSPAVLNGYKKDLQANAKSLQSMRAVFAKSFIVKSPVLRTKGRTNRLPNITLNQNFRNLSRLLAKESEVRIASGDANGAMHSRLDCLRLAVFAASRGGILDSLSAGAIESLALENTFPIICRLTGDQCLKFEREILKIQSFKPTQADALDYEKAHQVAIFRKIYGTAEWKQLISLNPVATQRGGSIFNENQLKKLKTLSRSQIEYNLNAVYDAIIARSLLPYQQAKNRKISSIVHVSPYSLLVAREDAKLSYNFIFTRNTTLINLLRANLLNIARRTKTSKPLNLTMQLPNDPFGNGQLKMNRQQIYSVGPDGIDNGGVPVPQLAEDAKGDILAF